MNMRLGACVEPPKRGDGYVANAMRLIFVLSGREVGMLLLCSVDYLTPTPTPTPSLSGGLLHQARISGGLLSGGLLSRATDFGSGIALIKLESLGVYSLGVYSLGFYCLELPILGLVAYLHVLRFLVWKCTH